MADNGGGSNALLGVVLGALLVGGAVLALIFYGGGFGGKSGTSTVKIEVPKVGTK